LLFVICPLWALRPSKILSDASNSLQTPSNSYLLFVICYLLFVICSSCTLKTEQHS